MRDIVLTGFIFGSLPFILFRPWLGVAMYIWVSVMNPHRLTWGFAYEIGFASIIATVTLLGLPFSKDFKWPQPGTLLFTLMMFLAWTGVSTLFALHPDLSYARWETLMKTGLMALLIPVLYHTKERLRLLIWVIVLSIAYYGVKGGVFTLATGGAGRVWGPEGSYIEDNNALAVAVIMVIPLMRYLHLTSPHKWVRWMLVGMMVSSAIAVLGSYSRGAFLAVLAMGCVFWWKGRHKLAVLLTALIAFPVALLSMPESWYDRMETIGNYEQDNSAAMRLNSWGTMWNVAKDRPFTGGGFELATPEVYGRYSPDPTFPPQVAHSIYMQALGEHGFVGLALYLGLLAALWSAARSVIRLSGDPGASELAWAKDFALMVQVAFAGYAVGGAFLSLINFDAPYYVMGIMIATAALVRRLAEAQSKPASHQPDAALRAALKSAQR